MSNRKNYNSILFLTVYLGLVLVGATPQVLAHAATNSLFDIRNEIEYKDDLDTKPDNDEINDFLTLEPEKAIAEFIEELRKIKKSGRRISNNYVEQKCSHSWGKNEGAASLPLNLSKSSNVKEPLFELWKKYEHFFTKVDFDHLPSFYKQNQNGKVEFNQTHIFGKDNLEITLNFTHGLDAQAKVFSDYLNREFVRKANEAKDLATKATYENTKAISTNGYITVVTRLPRGSIDSLLKQ